MGYPFDPHKDIGPHCLRFTFYDDRLPDLIQVAYTSGKWKFLSEMMPPNADDVNQLSKRVGTAQLHQPNYIPDFLPSGVDPQKVTQAWSKCINILKSTGKPDSVIRNAQMKWLFWLTKYFDENKPVMIQMKQFNFHDLLFLNIWSSCNTVVIIWPDGEQKYKSIDIKQQLSILASNGTQPFPSNFSIPKQFDKKLTLPVETNIWADPVRIKESLLVKTSLRGSSNTIKNLFVCYNGVADANKFELDVWELMELLRRDRKVITFDKRILECSPQQLASVKRMITPDKTEQISYLVNSLALQKGDALNLEYAINKWTERNPDMPMGRWTESVVKFIWHITQLKPHLGSCTVFALSPMDKQLLDFLDILSWLSIDVVIYNPNLSMSLPYEPSKLLMISEAFSYNLVSFPTSKPMVSHITTARSAEDAIRQELYDGSLGVYTDRQFASANAIVLKCTIDEVTQLWDVEARLRDGFESTPSLVTIPVIFAKICGVPNGDRKELHQMIGKMTEDKHVIFSQGSTMVSSMDAVTNYAEIAENGKPSLNRIMNHHNYKYSILNADSQRYLCQRIVDFLQAGIIKDFSRGNTATTCVTALMNLPHVVLQFMQNHDFTKVPPKLVRLIKDEQKLDLNSTVVDNFLSYIGFDVVYFIPTGYNVVDDYLAKKLYNTYELGEYMYDYAYVKPKKGLFSKLFK